MAPLVAAAVIAGALAPETAWAWGAGLHVAQGSFILANLGLVRPEIAAVISAFPLDYIYGCISADIFLGKGYRRHDDHCHNWSVGMRVLKSANDESTRAYAYGYLTHLASDIVAHNYFIPTLLVSTPAANKLGHVYWEFRADRFINKQHWTLASKVVSMHNHDNDDLIKRVMNRSKLRFGAKKLVFKRAVRMTDIMKWREHVKEAANGRRRITRRQVSTMNNFSINLVLDLLIHWDTSMCLAFDPVGTDNMVEAGKIRRSLKAAQRRATREEFFQVPGAIQELTHVNIDDERL